jgi:hypothetical protein
MITTNDFIILSVELNIILYTSYLRHQRGPVLDAAFP